MALFSSHLCGPQFWVSRWNFPHVNNETRSYLIVSSWCRELLHLKTPQWTSGSYILRPQRKHKTPGLRKIKMLEKFTILLKFRVKPEESAAIVHCVSLWTTLPINLITVITSSKDSSWATRVRLSGDFRTKVYHAIAVHRTSENKLTYSWIIVVL